MHFRSLIAKKRPEPSYPRLPQVGENGETNVPGIYAVGEVAGTPLIKLGLNAGHDLVCRLAAELAKEPPPAGADVYDLIVLGAGSAGLGAAATAEKLAR